MRRRKSMIGMGQVQPSTTGEPPRPVALFRNSLRMWQARWKAEQADPGLAGTGAAPDAVSGPVGRTSRTP